jgi:hypothetical protein
MSHREVVPDIGDDRRLTRRVCLVLMMVPGKEEEEKKEKQQALLLACREGRCTRRAPSRCVEAPR